MLPSAFHIRIRLSSLWLLAPGINGTEGNLESGMDGMGWDGTGRWNPTDALSKQRTMLACHSPDMFHFIQK